MARKKDTPQKAALREMMGNYLKENNVTGQGWNRCQLHHAGYDVHHPGRCSGSGDG